MAWTQAIGALRGGQTSKIHCLADDRGRPVALALTPGNFSDIKMALPILETVAPPKRLLADRAYDADSLRDWLKAHRITAVIPSSKARTVPHSYSCRVYHRRNVIERLFCRLKNWRHMATQYEKLARNYGSAPALLIEQTLESSLHGILRPGNRAQTQFPIIVEMFSRGWMLAQYIHRMTPLKTSNS